METHDPEAFLRCAEEHPEHYGPGGLETFTAAHHDNCTLMGRPWCFRTWAEYAAAQLPTA